MSRLTFLTDRFAVGPALSATDCETLPQTAIKTVICNRPDGEAENQLPASVIEAELTQRGLAFQHLPVTKHDLFDDAIVTAMRATLDGAAGPILATCESGLRSAILWAAAEARVRAVADILEDLSAAGFDLDFLSDDLEDQAAHARSADAQAAQQRRSAA